MPLRGSAFLALWNDIEPQRRAEYDVWHTFEHVPERVGIAGFVSGRRYVARERGEQRYFTLYELTGLGALEGADYVEVVERPTDWSRSMRPSFRNVVRCPCATVVSLGQGVAGSAAAFRFDTRSPTEAGETGLAQAAFQSFLATSSITAVHLGRGVSSTPPPSLERLGWNPSSEDALRHVLLVEALDRHELEAARPRLAETVRQRLDAVGDIASATFDLAFIVEKADLLRPTSSRQAARPDLRPG